MKQLKNLSRRIIWLSVPVLIAVGLFWLDQHRGGDIDRQMACILTNSKVKGANDEVLIFGSSRSNSTFDPYYMNSMLAFETLPEGFNIARYALLGRDNMSAYFLLENRIKYGIPPKIVVLELMLGSGSLEDRDTKIRPRHNAILNLEQQAKKLSLFDRLSSSTPWFEYMRGYIDRFNALVYGLIKHPDQRYWNAAACTQVEDWGRKGSAKAEHSAEGNSEQELHTAFMKLDENYDEAFAKMTAADSKWTKHLKKYQQMKKSKKKNSSLSPVYNLDKDFSQREIKDIQNIITLARQHQTKVILVAMPSYYENLEQEEYLLLQQTFPDANIYNIYEEANPTLEAYWHDMNHMTKRGSMLTSALLTRKILQEFEHD